MAAAVNFATFYVPTPHR